MGLIVDLYVLSSYKLSSLKGNKKFTTARRCGNQYIKPHPMPRRPSDYIKWKKLKCYRLITCNKPKVEQKRFGLFYDNVLLIMNFKCWWCPSLVIVVCWKLFDSFVRSCRNCPPDDYCKAKRLFSSQMNLRKKLTAFKLKLNLLEAMHWKIPRNSLNRLSNPKYLFQEYVLCFVTVTPTLIALNFRSALHHLKCSCVFSILMSNFLLGYILRSLIQRPFVLQCPILHQIFLEIQFPSDKDNLIC